MVLPENKETQQYADRHTGEYYEVNGHRNRDVLTLQQQVIQQLKKFLVQWMCRSIINSTTAATVNWERFRDNEKHG